MKVWLVEMMDSNERVVFGTRSSAINYIHQNATLKDLDLLCSDKSCDLYVGTIEKGEFKVESYEVH